MTRYLVTAALPYSNGRLHVGHIAGAYLPADTYVRYRRMRGDDVRFVCGSDDNGVAALMTARKEGRTVQELTAHYNARQQADFRGLGIEFDIYGGTHQPAFTATHEKVSQGFFRTIHEKGFFRKKKTLQLYDPEARQFLPDRYVRGTCYHKLPDGTPCGYPDAYGDQCEKCGNMIDPLQLANPASTISRARPEPRETTHWYLQLDQFQGRLAEWLEGKRDSWRPFVLNFVLGEIRKGLPERAMTRDLEWGVPVPLDDPDAKGKMLYVWFDAPIGYVSFTASMGDYGRWWKDPESRIVHFIGEDNIVFHALTWPAMLLAEGSFQLPWQVVANAFLNVKFPGKEEEKISKSRGTAVWIEEYLKSFDPDPLRYYLTAIAPESKRTAFDVEDFVTRNNSELANILGNFINRSAAFNFKYLGGTVPARGEWAEADRALLARGEEAVRTVGGLLDRFCFRDALGEVMNLARAANKYFESQEPWKARKTDPARCGTIVHACLRTVRTLATLMAPFLPFSAAKCGKMLKVGLTWDSATAELAPGAPLAEPEILYRQIDPKESLGT
jgi:methionyl-tRNA synthetase